MRSYAREPSALRRALSLPFTVPGSDTEGTETFQKLSVLMPVHNESRTIRTIVKRVLESPVDLEIELVCVDDGSSDNSLHVLSELAAADPRIIVIAHGRNFGKGKAIRTAIARMSGDLAIIQDADLEYDPKEYPKVVGPLLRGKADAVYGSRFAASPERRVLFYWHSLGNKLLTAVCNMANNLNLTDMETCYKAFRADVLRNLRLTCDRFGIEPEFAARLASSGARIYEVPISYYGRTYAEGKTIGWKDGVAALWLILKFRFFDTQASNDAGHAMLESLASAPAVAGWMVTQFKPFLGNRVLEAGCGMGNLTGHLIDRSSLTSVDIDPAHIEVVRRRFGHLDNVSVVQGDLKDPATYQGMSEFDTVICINVLEHVDRPEDVVTLFFKAVRSGGNALILVPGHDWLYSAADRAIGHRRRYEKESLRQLLAEGGFEVDRVYEFNRLGVLGWWTNKLVGRTDISRWQARAFGILLPVARLVERISALPGLSVVAIARKP